MKRETTKNIVIGERKFQIGKFDALTGSYIAFKLLTQILPILPMGGDLQGQLGALPLPKTGEIMSKSDFVSLQRDCLSVCSELVTVGGVESPMPILMPTGVWGVDGLQNDTMTVIALTIHALVFNVSSFFDEGALTALKESMSSITLFNAQT